MGLTLYRFKNCRFRNIFFFNEVLLGWYFRFLLCPCWCHNVQLCVLENFQFWLVNLFTIHSQGVCVGGDQQGKLETFLEMEYSPVVVGTACCKATMFEYITVEVTQ